MSEMILKEHQSGVISYLSDSSVTVSYGSGEEEFEVEYPLTKFESGVKLSRGDKIEAVIFLSRVPRSTAPLGTLYTEYELSALDAEWEQKKSIAVGDLNL